jgi:hypothetical protein
MRDIVVALVAVVALSIGYTVLYRHSRGEWEARVESALESAEAWEAQASVFETLADSANAHADSVQTVATERVRVVRERVVEVREVEVPAIAQPFVAQRDSIIDELLVAVDEKDEAIEEYVTAAEFLRKQVNLFEMRGDSLVAVLEDRPGPRKWWIPQAGAGGFVGACTGGGICSGFGLTFSWSF